MGKKTILIVLIGIMHIFNISITGAEKGTVGVDIIGNRVLSDDDWKAALSAPIAGKANMPVIYEQLSEVMDTYRSMGYYNVKVDSICFAEERSVKEMRIYVDEGEAAAIRNIEISGSSVCSQEKLTELLEVYEGDRFIERDVEEAIDRVIKWYENKGYPFSSVNIDDGSFLNIEKEPGVNLALVIDEGALVTIDTIAVEGNDFTKRNFVIRESGLKTGSIFNGNDLSVISRRFSRRNFVELAGKPELVTFPSSRNGVLLKVKEKSSNYFSGLLGYVPAQKSGNNEKGQINGFIDIALGNLFGTGRKLAVKWENRGGFSQDMDIKYSEPYLFGSPVMLSTNFAQAVQDSTYLKRSFSAECEVPLYSSFSGLFSFGYESTMPEDYGRAEYNLQKAGTYYWRIGVTYDSQDSRLNPRRGIYYSTFYSVGRRKNEIQSDSKEKTKFFDARVSVPTTRRGTVFTRFYGAQISSDSDDIPYSQLFPLGGARSLRGYKEKQFRGSTAGLFTVEYRYFLGGMSRIFVFYDGGYVKRDDSSFYKSGYGCGFRVSSKVGLIGFDYGIGEGDGPAQGKIHFGIQNYF